MGPLGIKGAGERNGRGLSSGNEYERHELCFEQFVKVVDSPEACRHFGEALRWRDTAARGIAAVRIASAFTALNRLGLMHAADVITPLAAPRIKISGRKYKLLGLRERANYVVELLGQLDNAWLSSAYQPLSSLGRRADWKPGEVVAYLRNFALHAERHAEFGAHSRRLADLAAHYAVDVFNAVILKAIGFRGPLAPSVAPFDLRAWIDLTDNQDQ